MSSMRAAGNEPKGGRKTINWQVTGQAEVTQPDATGKFQKGVNVTWVADNGTSGTVFVPYGQYQVATVASLIETAVERMGDVHSLQGNVSLG